MFGHVLHFLLVAHPQLVRRFNLLEPYLKEPSTFTTQQVVQIDPPQFLKMVERSVNESESESVCQ